MLSDTHFLSWRLRSDPELLLCHLEAGLWCCKADKSIQVIVVWIFFPIPPPAAPLPQAKAESAPRHKVQHRVLARPGNVRVAGAAAPAQPSVRLWQTAWAWHIPDASPCL